jgi:type IV pilus assembly protein PilA
MFFCARGRRDAQGRAGGAKRRGEARARKGFTLVEVIVVLVILAILAAIAIPALTGYIDKAQWRELELRTRTAKIAFQVMINEQYVDGGFTAHNTGEAPAGDFFDVISVIKTSAGEAIGYYFSSFTPDGVREYESLTGDTTSLKWRDTGAAQWKFEAQVDNTGAIKVFQYVMADYFPVGDGWTKASQLQVYYTQDAADSITKNNLAAQDKNFPGFASTVVSGYNIYRFGAKDSKLTFEKLYP